MNSFENLYVILVGAQEPMNVGASARAMLNFGLEKLILVAPEKRVLTDLQNPETSKAYKLAAHSEEVLDNLQVFDTLEQAVSDFVFLVGTSVRKRHLFTGKVVPPAEMAPEAIKYTAGGKVGIMFGREATGLRTEELDLSHLVVKIDTAPKQTSLNLAQAVLLLSYELFNASGQAPKPLHEVLSPKEPLERLFEDLRKYVLEAEFTDQNRLPYTDERFRRIFFKANLTPGEVQFLRGFLHQSRWFAHNGPKPTNES